MGGVEVARTTPRRQGSRKSMGAIEKDYRFPIPRYQLPETLTLQGEIPIKRQSEPSDPKQEYLIKRVVGKKLTEDGNIQYRVRWMGYSRQSDSLETLNLANPDERLVMAAEKYEKWFSKMKVYSAWRVRALESHLPLPHTRILCPLDPTVAKHETVFWPAVALCSYNINAKFQKWGRGNDMKQQVWIYLFKKNIVTPYTFTEAKRCISPASNCEYLSLCNTNLLNIKCPKEKKEYRAALNLSLYKMTPSFISGLPSGPNYLRDAIKLRQQETLSSDIHTQLFSRSGPATCTKKSRWNIEWIEPEFVSTLVGSLMKLCEYVSHPRRVELTDLLCQLPHHKELIQEITLRTRNEKWVEGCLYLMESAINNGNTKLYEELNTMLSAATERSTRLTPAKALQWRRRLMGRVPSKSGSRDSLRNLIPYNPNYATSPDPVEYVEYVEPQRKRGRPVEDAEEQPKRKRARIDQTQSA